MKPPFINYPKEFIGKPNENDIVIVHQMTLQNWYVNAMQQQIMNDGNAVNFTDIAVYLKWINGDFSEKNVGDR